MDFGKKNRSQFQDLMYQLPTVEVVPVKSRGNAAESLKPYLYYYGLCGTEPVDLPHALTLLDRRHADVIALKRAHKSAAKAAHFKAPRLALDSMHVLRLVSVDWAKAKATDPKRCNHRLMNSPTRTAMRELIRDAIFDISDSAHRARRNREWGCDDGVKRYFGWHLKLSLAGPRSTENHCRIHYCTDPPKGPGERLIIGHCGEHL